MPAKILVVEDHVDTRDALALILEREQFTVLTAGDGSEGLDKATRYHPDLIITDIMMPILDGIKMIERLRAVPDFSQLPIIVISAYSEKTAEAMRAGANCALSKPITVSLLISTIKKMSPQAHLIA
ncbi:MAG TPA: response regulator [Blastocatellia bacterium]|nr:response regulator [Blastocatellia bacterium]